MDVRCAACLSAVSLVAQSTQPKIFFSDLESGPDTGGQNGQGVFVTIWGKNFGATQGTSTVTVGGGAVAGYPVWSDGKITFQLGAAAATGNIVVNVPGAGSSNGLPFTVRAGNIFFVATTGSDANAGTFAAPWKTIVKAKNSMAAGDMAYIENGVAQTTEDDFTAYLSMDNNGSSNSGTAAAPKALIAYPECDCDRGRCRRPALWHPHTQYRHRRRLLGNFAAAHHWRNSSHGSRRHGLAHHR